MRQRSAALAVLALAGSLVLACGSHETGRAPQYRFVEPTLRAETSSLPPTASVDDETRPTLLGHVVRTLVRSRALRVPTSGQVVLRAELRGELRGARRLLVQPRVRRGEGWHALPTALVEVQKGMAGKDFVEVRFGLTRAGKTVTVSVKAFVAPDEIDPVHETRAVEIAPRSTLEFGIGLLAAGFQSRVGFSVEACEASGCTGIFDAELDPAKPEGWRDQVLSLARFSGREVSFRFITRHVRAKPEAFAFPVWSNPTVFAPRARAGPNFVLISLDTLRADHLPWHGYRRNTAPLIEARLVPRATLFDQCVAPASTTGPSHMTLFTSLPPLVHGIRNAAGSGQIPVGVRTLAQLLRAGDLVTGAVTENGPMGVHRGFGRGFDSFRENKTPKKRTPFTGPIASTFGAGRAWLEKNSSRRFFLFLHTYQAHTPYLAPGIYDGIFEDQPDFARFESIPEGERPIDYDREIRYAAREVADFLVWLEERGLHENTIVILTSDHGEAFMEHGFRFHGADLHEEILRVPLLIAGPGIAPGQRVEVPVGLIDLMPTILELAELPSSRQALGRSLAGFLRGDPSDDESWMSRALYSEAWQTKAAAIHQFAVRQPTFAVRRGHRKLIRYREGPHGFRYAYYDLSSDPRETRDMYAQLTEAASDLRELLDHYRPVAEKLRASLWKDTDTVVEDEIDPEREQKLRALGYID